MSRRGLMSTQRRFRPTLSLTLFPLAAGRSTRLKDLSLSPDDVGQGPMVLGGSQVEGALVLFDRLIDSSAASHSDGKVEVDLRSVGLDFQHQRNWAIASSS